MNIKYKIATSMVAMSLMTSLYANDTTKLDEVTVVSASGYEQDILKAPATISVITREQLEGKGYPDISAALKDVPGVFVTGGGNASGKGMGADEISIRGMETAQTLYLINGKPLSNSKQVTYNGQSTGQDAGFLPPMSAIERIEVIKGPMSSLYGSRAMGGVINIITKKVMDEWSGSMAVNHTQQEHSEFGNSQMYNFYAAGPVVKDLLNLSLTGQFFNKDTDTVYSGSNNIDNKNFGSKATWLLNDSNDIEFGYAYSKQKSYDKLRTWPGTSYRDTSADNTIVNRLYDVTHNLIWSDDYETTSYVQIQDMIAQQGSYDSSYESVLFNTKTVMSFDTNVLTLGFEYIDETTDHESERNQAGATNFEKYNLSFFAEDEYFVTDDFSLTVGARVNEDEEFGTEVTPRVYGVYSLNDKITLKGGVSAGYKTPELVEFSEGWIESAGRGTQWEYGNPDLEPEKSINYEIGINYAVNDELSLNATAYKTDYDDKISTQATGQIGDPTGGSDNRDIYQYVNIDEVELYGVELGASYTLDNVTFNANYTFNESNQKTGDNKGDPLTDTPKHMYNLGADWAYNANLNIWSKLKYTGSAYENSKSEEEYPAYTIVDMGFNYVLTDEMKVNFNINNLFDEEILYDEHYLVLDGRNFNIGLVYNF